MSTEIGGIHVNLTANSAQFQKGLKDARDAAKSFGAQTQAFLGNQLRSLGGMLRSTTSGLLSMKTALLGAAAALGAARAWGSIRETADHVDKLGKAALRLGMSVQELSALSYAAGQSGVEFETLAQMAGKAGKNVAEMVANGTTIARVGRMNVQLTDTFGRVRGIAQLLPDLAKGIQSASSEAEQLRLSQKFFGKAGGDQFVTWLKESGTFAAGLADQFAYAQRLGTIFTEDQFTKLRALGDSVGNLGTAWMGVKVKIVTQIAPAITQFLDDTALQLASMPRLVRASLSAFGSLAGQDTPARRAAQQALVDMKNSSIDLLKTGVIELGRLAGAAFVSAMRLGLELIAPLVTDLFRDALAPVLTNIPGLGDFQKSERGKLSDLRAALEKAEGQAAQARLADLRARMARLNAAGGAAAVGMGMGGGADPRVQMAQEIAELGADAQRLRRAIAVQEAIVGQQDVERLRGAGAAFAEFGAGMAKAADDFTTKLEPKVDAMQKARDGLLTFAPDDQVAIVSQNRLPNLFRVFDQIVDRAKATGEGIAAGMGAGWKKAGEQIRAQWKAHVSQAKELVSRADAITFELYPKAKFDADVRELRELKRSLDAIGLGSRLTQETVDARITELNKELQESLRKLNETEDALKDTFGGEVRDAIKGFASNVGDTFADLALEGKASFADLARSFARMMTEMLATKLMFEPLLGFIGQNVGTWINAGLNGQMASGGPGSPGFVGPVNNPAFYGVESLSAAGGVTVNVIDRRSGGAPVEVQERRGPDGRTVDVIVRDSVKKLLRNGDLDKDMRLAFGASRSGRV